MSRADRLFSWALLVGLSWLTFNALLEQGFEGSWYLLRDVMTFREGPPFQHRVLFVLLADAIQAALPGFGYVRCYMLSQGVAIVLTFLMVRRWSEHFVAGKLAFLGQFLLAAMLIPTFRYYTFYDIGTVFFFTACLDLLWRGQLLLYLVAFTLGTLNHEVILLVVPVAALVRGSARRGRTHVAAFVMAQLGLYAAARLALFRFLPAAGAWQSGKAAYNLHLFTHDPLAVAKLALTLLPWYVMAALGWKYATRDLKQCAWLLPLMGGTYWFVGQLNEPRLFDGFIPVAIGFVLCFLAASLPAAPSPGAEAAAR